MKVLANSTKMCYTYDSLSRVTARTVKKLSDNSVVSTEAFNYDAAGNVTSAPDSSFQYDTNNRLISFNGNTVSYDLDGNMLSNGSLTCTYDSANRLVSVDGHTYTYNAEDVRIRNYCECSEDTTYTYDTNCQLSQLLTKTTNGTTVKYVYGNGLIGEEVNSSFKTYHFDFRGSTIAITNASGTITDTFEYDTYGKLTSRTGTGEVIFGYNGRDGVVTDDNGLIYMRARYYSPEMKRFVNADIIPGEISNAITLNRYAYANGNPVSFVDPFGLSPDERGSTDKDYNYTRYNSIMYNGIEYEMFSPTYSSSDDLEGWKTVETLVYKNKTTKTFDWGNFLVGMVVNPDDYDGLATGGVNGVSPIVSGTVAAWSLLNGTLTSIARSMNFKNTYITFEFQNKDDNNRVVIKFASSDKRKVMSKYAGTSIRGTSLCKGMGEVAWFSEGVKRYYEDITGKKPSWFSIYDIKVSVGKNHKKSDDLYYFSFDDSNRLIASPVVYPGDSVKIGKGFLFFKALISLPINESFYVSKEYQNAFNQGIENLGLYLTD